jgi:hypothetical protein
MKMAIPLYIRPGITLKKAGVLPIHHGGACTQRMHCKASAPVDPDFGGELSNLYFQNFGGAYLAGTEQA